MFEYARCRRGEKSDFPQTFAISKFFVALFTNPNASTYGRQDYRQQRPDWLDAITNSFTFV